MLGEKFASRGSFCVCINDVNGSFFKEGKGLKQGVPSSSILLNLVDDVFTKMLSKAAKCRLIRGLLPQVVLGGIIKYAICR
jgi:hypothetical protein